MCWICSVFLYSEKNIKRHLKCQHFWFNYVDAIEHMWVMWLNVKKMFTISMNYFKQCSKISIWKKLWPIRKAIGIFSRVRHMPQKFFCSQWPTGRNKTLKYYITLAHQNGLPWYDNIVMLCVDAIKNSILNWIFICVMLVFPLPFPPPLSRCHEQFQLHNLNLQTWD